MKQLSTRLIKFSTCLFALTLLLTAKSFSQCQPDFTWSQTADNVIQITNMSTGGNPIDNYYDFSWGDGQYTLYCSLGDTPHVYNAYGTYTVCIYMYCGGVFADSMCHDVTLSGCNFNGASFYIYPDSQILHYYYAVNTSTGTPPLTYNWSWGDGTYDTIAYPSHQYASAGYYTICLTTVDSGGCSSTFCNYYYLNKLESPSGENTIIHVEVLGLPTSVQSANALESWSLFPNPASEAARVNYNINSPVRVTIDLFDVLGNRLQHLLDATEPSGEYHSTIETRNLSNGVYIVQLQAGDQRASQKLAVIK